MRYIKQKAFTLIELMMVVAIIGILAAIAYPSFQDSIAKSRRADAKSAILELSTFMERLYTATGCYNPGATDKVCGDGNDEKPDLPFEVTPKTGTAYYNLTVVATANTFTLTATPDPNGPHATDKCGKYTLTHTGIKGLLDNDSSYTIADCW